MVMRMFYVCRVYTIEKPEAPVHTFPLCRDDADTSFQDSRSTLHMDLALGENAVSFDFGQPIELQLKNK